MTKIINLMGGPGAGKTTLAGELFGYMKRKRMDVVYIDETAAQLIRSKSPAIDDQVFVTATQHHKQYSLLGEVEWIITDSPILLGTVYIDRSYRHFPISWKESQFKNSFKQMIFNLFDLYDNINFIVERGDREYKQIGRKQTEQEAKQIDDDLKYLLVDRGYQYTVVSNLEQVAKELNI